MSLTIVYPPEGSTMVCNLDIVAVHGLGGDAINTWTHPDSKAFWLKDFLPSKISNARILTFGYNADVAFSRSTAEVIDHARSLLSKLVDKRIGENEKDRPIIFIAHSLGGIVVKQALFQALIESRYMSVQNATIGILFFGTPHRGSDMATYGKVLARVAQKLSNRPEPELLKALETNSNALEQLTNNFREQSPRYRVVTFCERLSMKGLKKLIVEKNSALLEAAHEEQVPVNADHVQICKFKSEEDSTFETAWIRINEIRKESRPTSTVQAEVPVVTQTAPTVDGSMEVPVGTRTTVAMESTSSLQPTIGHISDHSGPGMVHEQLIQIAESLLKFDLISIEIAKECFSNAEWSVNVEQRDHAADCLRDIPTVRAELMSIQSGRQNFHKDFLKNGFLLECTAKSLSLLTSRVDTPYLYGPL